AATVANARRGVVVAGFGTRDPEGVARFAGAVGWPLLADAVSNARRDAHAIAYEALVRDSSFLAAHAPDVVVRARAPLTSKAANAWLEGLPTLLVAPDDEWLDPGRATFERVVANETGVFNALTSSTERAASGWLASWLDAGMAARRAMDEVLDADDIEC